MALTLNNIDINCNAGLQIARELGDEADELERAHTTCLGIIGDLRDSWTGSTSNRYLQLLNERAERLNTQAGALRELQQAIEKTVDVYRQEQTALYRAEQKKQQEEAAAKSKKKK